MKYRSTTQRLKSVQAKIDTGIARKPLTALDKENVRYYHFSVYYLGDLDTTWVVLYATWVVLYATWVVLYTTWVISYTTWVISYTTWVVLVCN